MIKRNKSYRKKYRYNRNVEQPTHNHKVDLLIKNRLHPESDREWLESLPKNKLNVIFATHLGEGVQGDADGMPRDDKGMFAVKGGTGHQVRQMRGLGIQARQVQAP